MFYIYEHIRPDTKAVFYVGKGCGRRAYSKKGRNNYWKKVVNKANGFEVKVVYEDIDENFVLFAEEELIDKYRRIGVNLVNQTNGGEGISGFKLSEQTKQKLREKAVGRKSGMKGRTHNEQTKQKLSQLALGRASGMKGLKHRPETIENLRKLAKERKRGPRSQQAIEKTAAFHTGRKRSMETRTAISNAKKGKKQNYYWITDGIDSKKFSKFEQIPDGWFRGRTGRTKVRKTNEQ